MLGWVRLVGGIVKLANKFMPSRDERAGRAKAERDQYATKQETLARMQDVSAGDKSGTVDDLRRGKF